MQSVIDWWKHWSCSENLHQKAFNNDWDCATLTWVSTNKKDRSNRKYWQSSERFRAPNFQQQISVGVSCGISSQASSMMNIPSGAPTSQMTFTLNSRKSWRWYRQGSSKKVQLTSYLSFYLISCGASGKKAKLLSAMLKNLSATSSRSTPNIFAPTFDLTLLKAVGLWCTGTITSMINAGMYVSIATVKVSHSSVRTLSAIAKRHIKRTSITRIAG